MGYTSYSVDDRIKRSLKKGYDKVDEHSMHTVFTQKKLGRMHDSMNPKGIDVRECRDSEAHPETFPVILALDVTGSMGKIPVMLIKDGLPKIIDGLLKEGAKDISLLFMGIGDHECDSAPLQVGQFESGDAELDLWLTRTYPEAGGGGNEGESYGLAHYFAANHCVTDAWEKRGKKGVLIVIGDEPNLRTYPNNAINEIMGKNNSQTFTDEQVLKQAQQKWEVYQINPNGSYGGEYWKRMLENRYIEVSNAEQVPNTIKNIVLKHYLSDSNVKEVVSEEEITGNKNKPQTFL